MNRAIKIKLFKVSIILLVLSCVCACGQKGELYLPSESVAISSVDFSNSL